MFHLFVACLVGPVSTTRVLHSRLEGLLKHGRQPIEPPWDLAQSDTTHTVPVVEESSVSAVGIGTGESDAVPLTRPDFFQPVKIHAEPAVTVAAVNPAYPTRHAFVAAKKPKDPLLCLHQFVGVNEGEGKECANGLCSDSEGVCRKEAAKRLRTHMRISPNGFAGSFLRAEVFPQNASAEPALRLVEGWRWEREDATWLVVVSPDNTSVFLSTVASWPEDIDRRDSPVRVLDLSTQGVPQMLLLQKAGQAEWRLEEAGQGLIRLRHVHQGRYLQTPTASAFWQALMQLWSPPPQLRSDTHSSPGSMFQVTPESALQELRNLGLIGQAPPPPFPRIPNIEVPLPLPTRHGKQLRTVTLPWGAFAGVVLILFCCCCAGGPSASTAADLRRDRKRKGNSDVDRRLQEVIERARRADLERALGTEGQLREQLKYVVGRARRIRAEAAADKRSWDPAPSLPEAENMLALLDARRAQNDSCDDSTGHIEQKSDGFLTPRAGSVGLHR